MKILYASGTPLAGVSELMARLVNEYYPEHKAAVLSRGPGKHAWYNRTGIKFKHWNVKDKEDCRQACEWADIIHCMANVGCRNLKVPDLLEKKVWVFQWHGAEIGGLSGAFLPKDYPHVRFIHIGQGWIERQQEYFDGFKQYGFKVVPNLISIDDPIHRPKTWQARRKNRIAFAPSNVKPGAVNTKGVPEIRRVCKDNFDLDLIMSCTFEECMKRKQVACLGIDEIVTPMYHRSGLEFLAQGTPCICSYNEWTESILMKVTGATTMPFINVTRNSLRDRINQQFAKSPSEQEEEGKAARQWIEKYYHPRDLLKRHLETYVA